MGVPQRQIGHRFYTVETRDFGRKLEEYGRFDSTRLCPQCEWLTIVSLLEQYRTNSSADDAVLHEDRVPTKRVKVERS